MNTYTYINKIDLFNIIKKCTKGTVFESLSISVECQNYDKKYDDESITNEIVYLNDLGFYSIKNTLSKDKKNEVLRFIGDRKVLVYSVKLSLLQDTKIIFNIVFGDSKESSIKLSSYFLIAQIIDGENIIEKWYDIK